MHLDFSIPHHLVTTHAKFFSRSGHRFFFKAMRLDGVGSALSLNEKLKLRGRLENLKEAHTTGLILTEAQSQPALDIVAAAGMVAIVELVVTVADLLDPARLPSTVSRLAHTANIYRSHSALCGYLVDFRLPEDAQAALSRSDIKSIRRRLRALLRTLKDHDSQLLVALKHRASVCFPVFAEEDFLYFETTALRGAELRSTIGNLHELAGSRPLIVELTDTAKDQDDAVKAIFGMGAAGVVARPLPGQSRDWLGIRALRAADVMPFVSLNGSCPPQPRDAPLVSIVVRAGNAEPTLRRCLEGLSSLAYPNYEVIVVDEGSSDRVAAIAAEFPKVRLIRKGQEAARIAGLNAAQGKFVAFTRADCVVDTYWLTFIVRKMQEDHLDACGGPVYASYETTPSSTSAALRALSYEEGHLAEANLVFAREALKRTGGLDGGSTFRRGPGKAGLRWGYSPVAFVSHLDSGTLRGYLAAQAAAGTDHAIQHLRQPDRFDIHGELKEEERHMLRSWIGSSEWTIFWAVVLVASVFLGISTAPALAMLGLGLVSTVVSAVSAPLDEEHRGIGTRVRMVLLLCAGSLFRGVTRYWTLLIHRHDEADEREAHRTTRIQHHHATIH